MANGKRPKANLQKSTREYPTEWSWYPADEEQDNTCLQIEKERERQPETFTAMVSYHPGSEYPTEWAWYAANEEQDDTCRQTENERERQPATDEDHLRSTV